MSLLLPKLTRRASSRRQIEIKGVKDDILLLPGNQYRAILETSAVNFELKSEAEQDALIETYQSFLNSLPCPLQIVVRVREVDVDHYLETFAAKEAHETEVVYKQQIRNYTTFVRGLVSNNKILTRRFYIVIPYAATNNATTFDLVKEQLTLTQDIVRKGLAKMGMRSRRLTNLEMLELFYSFYNQSYAKAQPLTGQTMSQLLEKGLL